MFKGFKAFITKGNVVDLAVAVVIGGAFGAVIASLVADVISPAIGAIAGKPDFSAVMVGPIKLGSFINAIINFLFVALAIYYFVVVPIKNMEKKKAAAAEAAPPAGPSDEVKLLTEIRDSLSKS